MASQAEVRKRSISKLAAAIDKIDSLSIRVERVDLLVVRHQAVVWWNRHRARDNDFVSLSARQSLIDRVVVNYIRHTYTKYDKLVLGVVGRPGQRTCSRRLHTRILAEIAAVYPSLSDECKRQIASRQSRDLETIRTWVHDDNGKN